VLSANSSALVAGSTAPVMQTKFILVRRAFFDHQKKVLPIGAIVEVPAWLAAEAIQCGKASPAEKPAPVAPPVVEPDVVPEPAPEPKGKRFNARK